MLAAPQASAKMMVFALSLCCAQAADWSFKDFLSGQWDMERHGSSGVDHAHYTLAVVGDHLEGTYHEDGEFGATNEMKVRVLFDDDAGHVGQFQLAKAAKPKQPTWEQDSDMPPTPQPEPEPKTAFDFAFRPQSEGRFYLSESKWLGKAGGTVQFLAAEDTFVFTKVVLVKSGAEMAAQVTSWTAVRQGAPRVRAANTGTEKKRSMLQRYGWYLFFAFLYAAYKAATSSKASSGAKKKA